MTFIASLSGGPLRAPPLVLPLQYCDTYITPHTYCPYIHRYMHTTYNNNAYRQHTVRCIH